MRIPRHPRGAIQGVNMTPMIDVVFQLIIFFLVSSHLAQHEARLPVPLPLAASGLADAVDGGSRVTINVLADGQMTLAGRPLDGVELASRLRTRLDEIGPDLEVRLRSDRTVAYRYIDHILGICARAGIWNVTFAVYRPEDVR